MCVRVIVFLIKSLFILLCVMCVCVEPSPGVYFLLYPVLTRWDRDIYGISRIW